MMCSIPLWGIKTSETNVKQMPCIRTKNVIGVALLNKATLTRIHGFLKS